MPHYRGTAYVHIILPVPVDRIEEDDTLVREQVWDLVHDDLDVALRQRSTVEFDIDSIDMSDVIETPRGDGPDSGQH